MKFQLRNKKLSLAEQIITYVFMAALLVYVVFFAFGQWIFGLNSEFYRSLNLFSGAGDPNIAVRIISYTFFIFGISWCLRILLELLLPALKKSKGLMTILISVIKYMALLVWIFFVLSSFNVDTTVILAGLGIVSLIVGLAIQPLLSDIIAGLFIIFEDVYNVGDVIVADGFRGTVKEIGMRHTQILDDAGNIKVINNSDIRSLVNMTDQLSLAICDMSIEYGESLERVEAIIAENLDKIREAIPEIKEGPYYKGVSELGDSAVVLKFIAKCDEGMRFQVQRDMNRQFKLLFDKNNINIPFPQVVVNKPTTFEEATHKEKKVAKEFVEEQKEVAKGLEDANGQSK